MATPNHHSPSVALNNQRWLLQVYKQGKAAFYRIGKIIEKGDSIEWSNVADQRYDDSGMKSRVCMNDKGVIIEVFERRHRPYPYPSRCHYRTGLLNTIDERVDWRPEPVVFASGASPCVAVNNSGIIVVVYEKARSLHKDLFFRVGDLDDGNHTIHWRKEEKMLLGNCWNPSISLNDLNGVAFSFTSSNEHSFATGYVEPGPSARPGTGSGTEPGHTLTLHSVQDSSKCRIPDKHHTVVGLNNHGHLVAARIIHTNVSFFGGRLGNDHVITERELRRSDAKLLNTSYDVRTSDIAVNGRNEVVFVCHVSHGILNHNTTVFTALGKLSPR